MKLPKYGQIVAIGFLIITFDQLSKYIAFQKGVATYNSGSSFGLFGGFYWPLVIVPVIGWLVLWLYRARRFITQLGLILIISAGLSNLADRLLFGSVRDFIHYPVINVVGNLADIFIVIGLIILLTTHES